MSNDIDLKNVDMSGKDDKLGERFLFVAIWKPICETFQFYQK